VLFQLGVSLALKEVWGEDVLHGDLLKNGRFLFYHANFMPSSYAIRSCGNIHQKLALIYGLWTVGTTRHGLGRSKAPPGLAGAVLANGGAVMPDPTDDQIRTRAHQLWEQAGKPEGREDEFWHQAEKELQEEKLREITNEPPPTILPG
jgi:Protein of unknown function (DUF2934)